MSVYCYGCWNEVAVNGSLVEDGKKTYICDNHGRIPESWARPVTENGGKTDD